MTNDTAHFPEVDIKNLKADHTYLLRYGITSTISSATILLVTETSYRIRWNNGVNSNETWELKEHIERVYNITEDITKLVEIKAVRLGEMAKPIITVNKYAKCYACHGLGTVPNNKTAGTMTCPVCNGDKLMPYEYETIQEE